MTHKTYWRGALALALTALVGLGALTGASAHPDPTSSQPFIASAAPFKDGTSSDGSENPNHSFDPADEREQRIAHYKLDTAGLADEVASSGRLTVRGTSDEPLVLNLKESELFLPGKKKVVVHNEDGTTTETAYLGRTFTGALATDSASHAAVLIAPEGLYGAISTTGKLWSFQRSTEQDPSNGPTEITEEVISYVAPAPDPMTTADSPLGALGLPVEDPTSPGMYESAATPKPTVLVGSSGSGGGYTYAVQVYADPAYRDYASDWSNRMVSALNDAINMWSSETGITLTLYGLEGSQWNFAPHAPCQSGNNDGGLDVFRQWLDSSASPGPNAYGLFEGFSDMGNGIGGCAPGSALDYNYRHTGAYGHNHFAAFVINAKDWTYGDSWNPGSSHDLGIGAAHEMTHLAGEGSHPTNSRAPCDYNIMANGKEYWCRNMWRASTTISAVKSYAYPYM